MFDAESGNERARFVDHVVDMLGPVGATARRMFGGYGIFLDGLMFALIADDRPYFKADDDNRGVFEDAGGEPFTYLRRGKAASLNYYSVPDDALEDPTELRGWAEHGLGTACGGGEETEIGQAKHEEPVVTHPSAMPPSGPIADMSDGADDGNY